jgi:hypothetical protein
MNDLIGLHPPLNIVGYQVPKHFCTECPYAPTIVGTHSKYNYNPTQNILLDDEMIGDTINIFIESVFNTEGGVWYHGHDAPVPKETIEIQGEEYEGPLYAYGTNRKVSPKHNNKIVPSKVLTERNARSQKMR